MMSADDDSDLVDSWIEVTPQTLGYHLVRSELQFTTEPAAGLGLFHTNVEEKLLTQMLSEAQDHSDRASETAPRSPPPSREGLTPSDSTDPNRHSTLPPGALLYAAAVRASSLGPSVTVDGGEWASRPEVGGFLSVPEKPDSPSSETLFKEQRICMWSIRNSRIMKSQLVNWLIDRIPSFMSHAATFFLGAATMLFLLRKRIDWSKVLRHLPLG